MRSMIDMCFMCSNDNNQCNVVDHKIVTQVEYLMPEITIIKLSLPLRFCSICEKNLELFSIFKKHCVENSIRLEKWVKAACDNTDMIEKCTTSETYINKIDDICIKEELFDKSDNLELKYSSVDEICSKEDPPQKNLYECKFDIIIQENLSQTDTYDGSIVDMDNERDQKFNDPDYVVSINNEISTEENILVNGSPERRTYTIKEEQYNTDIQKTCRTSETNINKIHEVYIKEEVVDESDTTVKDFFVEEIYIKENPYDREVGDELQKTLKEDSPLQTDNHLHEGSSVDSDQNSEDPDDVVSDTNGINCDENILVTGSPGRKTYTCLICNKSFKDFSYLKIRHMKMHLGQKDFQCNECKKMFSQKSHLTIHMKQHTGIKEFQCKECKKEFTRKSHLTIHMKKHTGVKDFECSECNKCFSQKSDLTRHMKQHSGVKIFYCNECKKWFSRKSHWATHMKRHTYKNYCFICNQLFLLKENLEQHMERHNNI